MVFLFSVLGAAMFAKPTIAKVEKVIGLIHKVGFAGAGCPRVLCFEAPNTALRI